MFLILIIKMLLCHSNFMNTPISLVNFEYSNLFCFHLKNFGHLSCYTVLVFVLRFSFLVFDLRTRNFQKQSKRSVPEINCSCRKRSFCKCQFTTKSKPCSYRFLKLVIDVKNFTVEGG